VSGHDPHRTRSGDEKDVTHFPLNPPVHPPTDELAEYFEASSGIAMSLANDECLDDRPPAIKSHPAKRAENAVRPRSASSALTFTLQTQPPDVPGLFLRRRREQRGLTIDDLSRTTKISRGTLMALETGDVLHLPAPIYTRGFVKTYAREVGLDPERTADDYLASIEPLRAHHPLVDENRVPSTVDGLTVPVDANGDARNVLAANQVRRIGRLMTAAAVIALVLYIASFNRREQDASDASMLGTAAELAAPTPATGSAAEGVTPAAAAAVADGSLRVEFVTQGPCWLSARVDGQRVLAKLLQAGERHTIDISDEAVLRVGDAGALSFSINGQTGRSLGRSGQPVSVRITKDNFREFLSS
jgi:cytoskeleton protein RodZ